MPISNNLIKCGCSSSKSKPAITMMAKLVKESQKQKPSLGNEEKVNAWNKNTNN